MPQNPMSPLPTFTLESLVALRQWTAEQRMARKKTGPAKTERRTPSPQTNNGKTVPATELTAG
jgi:hypothetical protein